MMITTESTLGSADFNELELLHTPGMITDANGNIALGMDSLRQTLTGSCNPPIGYRARAKWHFVKPQLVVAILVLLSPAFSSQTSANELHGQHRMRQQKLNGPIITRVRERLERPIFQRQLRQPRQAQAMHSTTTHHTEMHVAPMEHHQPMHVAPMHHEPMHLAPPRGIFRRDAESRRCILRRVPGIRGMVMS
jgi:hypothetical protein